MLKNKIKTIKKTAKLRYLVKWVEIFLYIKSAIIEKMKQKTPIIKLVVFNPLPYNDELISDINWLNPT